MEFRRWYAQLHSGGGDGQAVAAAAAAAMSPLNLDEIIDVLLANGMMTPRSYFLCCWLI